jgi:hypothetical protein
MGKVPKKPKKVSTPGSYKVKAAKVIKAKIPKQFSTPSKKSSTPSKKSSTSSKISKKGKGRPSTATKRPRHGIKFRDSYTEEDLQEAIRLVQEEQFSVSSAAVFVNEIKRNKVPRMTLTDRLRKDAPAVKPTLGRPQEWHLQLLYRRYRCGTIPYLA